MEHNFNKSHNSFFNSTNEKAIFYDITKTDFFKWMSSKGLSSEELKEIFEGKKMNSFEQNKFNMLLRKVKSELLFSIVECLVYLDEAVVDMKKLVCALDSETKYIVKRELSEKYRIPLDKTNLSEILE